MARKYRLGPIGRGLNAGVRTLIRAGLVPPETHLLTTRGRRSGRVYSTPVQLVIEGERRWLVAPYGHVGWVHNARASGRVTLSRGGRSEELEVSEVGPREAGPILKRYVEALPVVRPYFDAGKGDPPEAFMAEADRHPVFRLGPEPSTGGV